jgi:hypothetical protein
MARLVVRQGRNPGTEYQLPPEKQALQMGRSSALDVQVFDPQASREHSEIGRQGEGFYVRDLGSRNGTFLEKVKVKGRMPLRPGQQVSIGETVYVLIGDDGEGAAEAQSPVGESGMPATAAAGAQTQDEAEDCEKGGTKVLPAVGVPFFLSKKLIAALAGGVILLGVIVTVVMLSLGRRSPEADAPAANDAQQFDDYSGWSPYDRTRRLTPKEKRARRKDAERAVKDAEDPFEGAKQKKAREAR